MLPVLFQHPKSFSQLQDKNFKTAELEKKLKYLYFTDDMILYIENHKKVEAGLGLRAFPDLLTALLSWAEPAGC